MNKRLQASLPLLPDITLLAMCAAVLSAQLFIRPFIGLADNGDFSKVTGRLSLAPEFDVPNFTYVVPVYVRSHNYRWYSDFLTSETLPAAFASALEKTTGPPNEFDIRYMGAVHAIIFFLAFVVFLFSWRHTPPLLRFSTAGFALFVFTDVMYTSYYNSYYSDTIALLSLLWMVVLGLLIISTAEQSPFWLFVFAVAAGLFVTSKAQHALAGWIPAVFLARVAWQNKKHRIIAGALALLVVIGSALQVRSTPSWVKGMTAFDVVFHQITLGSPHSSADLRELGLDGTYDQYVGQYAYMKGSPAQNPDWAREFHQTVGYGVITRFYLRHPYRTLAILDKNLKQNAIHLRPIANFCLGDGHPPRAITHAYAVWSDLKTRTVRFWPECIIAWYAVFVLVSTFHLRNSRIVSERNATLLALGVCLLGLYEFGVATLADAAETGRHLFLFHACTDVTVCFAVAGIAIWTRELLHKVLLIESSDRLFIRLDVDQEAHGRVSRIDPSQSPSCESCGLGRRHPFSYSPSSKETP